MLNDTDKKSLGNMWARLELGIAWRDLTRLLNPEVRGTVQPIGRLAWNALCHARGIDKSRPITPLVVKAARILVRGMIEAHTPRVLA